MVQYYCSDSNHTSFGLTGYIYVKPFGAGNTGRFLLEKNYFTAYNISEPLKA